MNPHLPLLAAFAVFASTASPLAAQTARQNSAVAVNPLDTSEVWVANRGNDSVSVIDTSTDTTVAEIDVGVWPRSLAFSADGQTVFVANQRGNVAVTTHFVTPFTGSEVRGSISVIDVGTRAVVMTLNDAGTEPYGLAVAPNGEWFAVTGFRSGTVHFYDTDAPYSQLLTFTYDHDMNEIPMGSTLADIDSNGDMIPDLADPRALSITSDSQRIFVTHAVSGFVSVLDLTLDVNSVVTAAALNTRIDLNTYPFHPIFAPTPVQTLASQGVPRSLDDIALSPDGTLALVPHVLHNINHDVNHDFGPSLAGDFANRVYPSLTAIDAQQLSYDAPGDASFRLHHELTDPLSPAEHAPFGGQGVAVGGGILTLGGTGAPVLGGTADYTISGSAPGDMHVLYLAFSRVSIPTARFGTLLLGGQRLRMPMPGNTISLAIPTDVTLDGVTAFAQALVIDGMGGGVKGLTNGVETEVGTVGFEEGKFGYRAGHPERVLFNADGDRALLLNRGSEDVFLFAVSGTGLTPMTVFPPRQGFVERAPLDPATPLGDLPLGMALVEDASTSNRDALLYVINETTRTMSSLRIDWDTGVITQEAGQAGTLLSSDRMSNTERIGQELFEDASRAQTAGNFNNSCHSCHFEGGADGNVWQRSNGPRSTMPVYGGTLLTGTMLWKGVRLNMGETGPMFAGENGGTGVMGDLEQQGLSDYHEIIPVPLNPNLDPMTGDLTASAALGQDLFLGTNDTGMNGSLRHAGCFTCHPDMDTATMTTRAYTTDFLDPLLSRGENLQSFDPSCFSLRQNIILSVNIENVNSGVNVDVDNDGFADMDRNGDGVIDIESYMPMNVDRDDDFERDDTNSYMCPETPGDPMSPLRTFFRDEVQFSIPTKLGVFATGPYFHDHSAASLRLLLDPTTQQTDPVYGNPAFPALNKFHNEFHDVRGLNMAASKVQLTLQTVANGSTIDADVQALLDYIRSL